MLIDLGVRGKRMSDVVGINNVTIIAIGLLNKFWSMVIGCFLCTAGIFLFETMQTRSLR